MGKTDMPKAQRDDLLGEMGKRTLELKRDMQLPAIRLRPKLEALSLLSLRQFFRMKREHLGYTIGEMA